MAFHHEPVLKYARQQSLIHVTRLSELISFQSGFGFCDFSESHTLLLKESAAKLNISNAYLKKVSGELVRAMDAYTNIGLFNDLRLQVA
jgi:hypothetical protein